MGSQETGIYYVIRPDLPVGYVPQTSKEILRYELPLNGRKYDKDNSVVFGMLAAATLGTQGWTYVNEHKNQLDGRGAMKKVPENLNVSDCAPATVQRQAGTRPKAWPLEERM